jgi:hypothetical protein
MLLALFVANMSVEKKVKEMRWAIPITRNM